MGNLNNQVQGLQNDRGNRKFIFKDGVRYRHMTGDSPMMFRIAPAFNPNDTNPGTSYVPFVDDGGSLADFALILRICRFVGHGRGGFGTRRDLLSLKTFEQPGEEIFDPLDHLLKIINQSAADWGYLIKDRGEGQNRERSAYGKSSPHLILNIWDFNQPTVGIQLGCFTSSACNALLDPKTGLAYQRTNIPEEMLKQNYLAGYAVGDLTDPNNGPAVVCAKGKEQGDFSKYKITLLTDMNGGVVRKPLTQELLAQRYNLSDPGAIINIPTEDELIDALVQLLNMRSPTGMHEHALLKMAFPQFSVPEPPAAPAASPTVQAGFGGSPAAGYQSQTTTVAPGGAPVPVPTGGTAVPPAPVPTATPAPAPTQPAPAPAGGTAVPPTPAPAPAPTPAPEATPPASSPEAQGAEANAAAAGQPTVPGDSVPFNSADFQRQLEQMGKQ
jgi:hypothetical protein